MPRPTRRTVVRMALSWLLGASLVSSVACHDTTAPAFTFVGEWALVSFSDHGTVADAVGSMVFYPDGTFRTEGLLTFPGQGQELLEVDGTYEETPDGMVITIGTQKGTWTITHAKSTVKLSLKGPTPTTEIVMKRPA